MACRLLVCALALVLGSATLARADYSVLRASRTGGFTVLACEPVSDCTVGTQQFCDGGGECRDVNIDLSICLPATRPLAFETFCCETIDDCPRRSGVDPQQCQLAAGDVSVCVYGGSERRLFSLCAGGFTNLTLDGIAACFATDSNATGLLSLANGDCDGDGHINSADATPCVSDIVPPADAGVQDSGTIDEDSSVIIPPADQGDVDSGNGGRTDAGSNPSFRGAGGCAVSAATASRKTGTAAALALAVLAGLVARRRRR